jgi:hypothetical protein
MKLRRITSLSLLVLAVSMVGCGSSNNSLPCRSTAGHTLQLSVMSGAPLSGNPYARLCAPASQSA